MQMVIRACLVERTVYMFTLHHHSSCCAHVPIYMCTSRLQSVMFRKLAASRVVVARSSISTSVPSKQQSSVSMATVGVVTTVGCPYCKKAKAALKEKGVPYQEADLGSARDVLAKVKETTGQTTVPQIFIGGDFVGGASQLLDLIAQDGLQSKLTAAAGKAAFPDAIAELVAQHAKEEKPSAVNPELLAVKASLKEKAPRVKVGSSSGVKKDALEIFLKGEAPTFTIEKLLEARLIAPMAGSSDTYTLTDDARALPLKLGNPLNCHVEWYGTARSAVDVSGELRARILELYDAYLAQDGKAVDYEGMRGDARFDAYVDATVELTKVDLSQMSRNEKIAFFVNVYNALIVHATVAHGVPSNVVQRLRFFRKANYVIGGATFSADDMEHGVLRSNAVAPGSLGALLGIKFLQKNQFPSGDSRATLSVSPLDPRIHFALVCGAKSCPPIKLYTPDNLDEGLQEAAIAFCEGEITVDMTTRTVVMSKIFDWYGKDFAIDIKERLAKFAEFCNPEKKANLLALSKSAEPVNVQYKTYDWTVNSK